jgi:hypothetical protein
LYISYLVIFRLKATENKITKQKHHQANMTNSDNIKFTSTAVVQLLDQGICFTLAIQLQERIRENLKKVGIEL